MDYSYQVVEYYKVKSSVESKWYDTKIVEYFYVVFLLT